MKKRKRERKPPKRQPVTPSNNAAARKLMARLKATLNVKPEPNIPTMTDAKLRHMQQRILKGQTITDEELSGVQRLLRGHLLLNRTVRSLTMMKGRVGVLSRTALMRQIFTDIDHIYNRSDVARKVAPVLATFPVLASPRLGAVKTIHKKLNELKVGSAIAPGLVPSAKRNSDAFDSVGETCFQWVMLQGIDVHEVSLADWKGKIRPMLLRHFLPGFFEDGELYAKLAPLIRADTDQGKAARIRARIRERSLASTAALLGLKGKS